MHRDLSQAIHDNLPRGLSSLFGSEPEFAQLRAAAQAVDNAEAKWAGRAAARAEQHTAAVERWEQARHDAVLSGEPAPPAPADPGAEPGWGDLQGERHMIGHRAGEVWREHGAAITARLLAEAKPVIDRLDQEHAELQARVRELEEQRHLARARCERLTEAARAFPPPPLEPTGPPPPPQRGLPDELAHAFAAARPSRATRRR